MGGWRDHELRLNRFTGRNDDLCTSYDRDWRYLINQETINEFDREELRRILAERFLSDTEIRMIKRVLGD